jgi:hypothetical protein
MSYYTQPGFYRSMLGIAEFDGNVSSNQIFTQSITVSNIGTGLVSSASGLLENAIIGGGLDFSSNTLTNTGVNFLASGDTNFLINNNSGAFDISLSPNVTISTSLTIGSLSGILKATTGLISGSSTTDDLPEGASNQYFTTSRARSAFTATLPISILTGVISLGYNTGNLKITANQLNTIQNIATNSTPIFARISDSSVSTNNVLIGNNSGSSLTTAGFNCAVGSGALQSITTTGSNTAVGYQALNQCVGSSNTSLGQTAGYSVTSGGNNVFCGWQAGRGSNPLTTGNFCTYLGSSSLPSGGAVNGEIVLGSGIGSGSNTTTIYAGNGLYVSNLTSGLLKSTSGLISQAASSDFVASITGTANQVVASSSTGAITLSLPQSIGTSSSPQFARILNSSIGLTNVLIGTNTGTSLTTGGGNTFIGAGSGTSVTSGTFNVAIGAGCLGGSGAMNVINACNVAIGKNALYSCATTATDNFAVGYNALQSVTTGSGNIAIGYFMANTLTTGSNNIYLGHGTTPSAVSVSDECVLNVSATNVTGKGANTCFINATAGLFSYIPLSYNLWNNNAAVSAHVEQWVSNTAGGANFGTAPTITAGVLTGLTLGKYNIAITGTFFGSAQTLYPSIQYKASGGSFVTVAVIAVSFPGAWFSPMALTANVQISNVADAIQLYYPTTGVYGAGNPGSDPSYYVSAGNYLPRYMSINYISL